MPLKLKDVGLPLSDIDVALGRIKAEEARRQSNVANIRNTVEIPEKCKFLYEPWRYKVGYGGRYSVKSWSWARALLVTGIERPTRIMCARETMLSLAESVHHLLQTQIRLCGLQEYYDVQKALILGKNGTQFFFAGLRHNIQNLKSVEGVDIVWIEEAETVSKESWDTLVPTIRKDGSEIWLTFNPRLATDETYLRFVKFPPTNAKVIELSYRDNKWMTPAMYQEMQDQRQRDPVGYQNIYEGVPRSTVEGAVYQEELLAADNNNQFTRVPYDPHYPVDTAWDLGFGDLVSIWFFQRLPFEYRIIDYYENSQKSIDFYMQVLQSKGYTYGTMVLPWDGATPSIQTGKSVEQLIRAKGFTVKTNSQLRVHAGINAVRTVFPQCYFDNDKCADGISRLRNYQWGPKPQSGKLQREPLHDEASHGADGFRTFAVYAKPPKKSADFEPRVANPWADDPIPNGQAWMGV